VDPQQLSDVYEIQVLKARYFRFMDTRQWDAFRDLFTDDMQLVMDDAPIPEASGPTFASADALVEYLRQSDPGKLTVHQGHMPEIEFVDADHATGIWAMFDWVDDPARGGAWQGYGHYHERYTRGADGRWRISHVHLTRLRSNTVAPKPNEAGPRPRQIESR
jgi:hypothetical protein